MTAILQRKTHRIIRLQLDAFGRRGRVVAICQEDNQVLDACPAKLPFEPTHKMMVEKTDTLRHFLVKNFPGQSRCLPPHEEFCTVAGGVKHCSGFRVHDLQSSSVNGLMQVARQLRNVKHGYSRPASLRRDLKE